MFQLGLTDANGLIDFLVGAEYVSLRDAEWDDGEPRRTARFEVLGDDEPAREVRERVFVGRGAAVPLQCTGLPDVVAQRADTRAFPLRRDAWSAMLADERDRVLGPDARRVALVDGTVVVVCEGDDGDAPVRAAQAIAAGLEAVAASLPLVDTPEVPDPPPAPFVAPSFWRKQAWWTPSELASSPSEPDAIVLHYRDDVSVEFERRLLVSRPSTFDPNVKRQWNTGFLSRVVGDDDLTPHRLLGRMGDAADAVYAVEIRAGRVFVLGVDDPTGQRDVDVVRAADAVSGSGPVTDVSPGLALTKAFAEREGRGAADVAAKVVHSRSSSSFDHRPGFRGGGGFIAVWTNPVDGGPVGRITDPRTGAGLQADPGSDPELLPRAVAHLARAPWAGDIEIVATGDVVWVASRLGRSLRSQSMRKHEIFRLEHLVRSLVA